LQKSWVKLSRSLRSKTKRSRTKFLRTKLKSEIILKKHTIMKLASTHLQEPMRLTEADEEAKEALVNIVAEVVGAVEELKEKANLPIVGEADTTKSNTQMVIPPKTMVMLDPTIEVKEAALKVNLKVEVTTEETEAIVEILIGVRGVDIEEKEEATEAKEETIGVKEAHIVEAKIMEINMVKMSITTQTSNSTNPIKAMRVIQSN
jgi:hypothetical protein